jgi:hypothetical protein
MDAEHLAQPGFAHRQAACWAVQDDEAFQRATTRRALRTEIGGALGEERVVDRDFPFPAALADDPHPPQAHVDIGQTQRSCLGGAQSAQHRRQHDRPITVRVEIGDEGGHRLRRQALRQPLRFAGQPPAAARTDRDMTQQTVALAAQPRRSTGRRDRVVRPSTGHHQMLEQAAHRGDSPVHRRRRRTTSPQRHHRAAACDLTGLPVEVVEQIRRHHRRQLQRPLVEEPGEVRQIERVRPHRRRREAAHHQMVQEPVARLDHRPVTDQSMPLRGTNHTNRHHGLLVEYPTPRAPSGGSRTTGVLRAG